MKNKTIIIGTRGSKLALWQANYAKDSLKKSGIDSSLKTIKTQGDKNQELSFDKIEGKGFFIKEIEDALLKNEIDLAVHSYKDLPTVLTKGLRVAAVSERENPSDCLIIRKECIDKTRLFSLKSNAVVGTSSARRKSQLLGFREDVIIKELRGNVPTRVDKLRAKQFDAIMIAYAGIKRLELDLSEFQLLVFSPTEIVPAPAQGVIAYQIREEDKTLWKQLKKINYREVELSSEIERKILNSFEGGCNLPLGVYCIKKDDRFNVWVSKAISSNKAPVRIFQSSVDHKRIYQKIVSKIKHLKPKTVFITRDLNNQSFLLRSLKTNNFDISGKSLIQISPIKFQDVPETDWIFFSSKNGVEYFFSQYPLVPHKTKLAAIGSGTANSIKQLGKTLSFIGSKPDTHEIAVEFSVVAKGSTVLFPGAINGLRTVQKNINKDIKKIEFPVYESKPVKGVAVPRTDIIIFTSPGNVEAFLINNKVQKSQKAIAIGKSTAKKLKEYGIDSITSTHPDETGLCEAVYSL